MKRILEYDGIEEISVVRNQDEEKVIWVKDDDYTEDYSVGQCLHVVCLRNNRIEAFHGTLLAIWDGKFLLDVHSILLSDVLMMNR